VSIRRILNWPPLSPVCKLGKLLITSSHNYRVGIEIRAIPHFYAHTLCDGQQKRIMRKPEIENSESSI